MSIDTVMYSGKCNHGNIAAQCNLCVKEREANTSAAAIDKRERMAFEAFLAWMVSPNVRGTLQEGAVAAFEAADAFIKAANEMRGKA